MSVQAQQTAPAKGGKTTVQPNATRANQVAAEKAAKAEKARAAAPKKEPKPDLLLPKKITVATEGGKNPKREGTASHARFALYRANMTVAQYLDACEAAKQSRRHARADVNWDVKHGFVTLSD